MALTSIGLERTEAEPLGKTAGLDLLQLYEEAADNYFAAGHYGRALEFSRYVYTTTEHCVACTTCPMYQRTS